MDFFFWFWEKRGRGIREEGVRELGLMTDSLRWCGDGFCVCSLNSGRRLGNLMNGNMLVECEQQTLRFLWGVFFLKKKKIGVRRF